MTISEIKAKLGYSSMDITQQKDEQNVPQPWASFWDNERRVRVTMHMDVFAKIAADRNTEGLALKHAIVPATPERAAYTRYVIITPKDILATF